MNSYETRLLRVLDHIHDNPAADLSLDALADVAAMSRFHWHRVFHAMTGETAVQAVRRVRLHRGACYLVQTPDPVTKIAARVGYDNAPSFARAFAQTYGLTPTAFRKRGQITSPLTLHRKGETQMFDVTIEQAPARRLAALAHKGPYLEIGKTYDALGAVLSARGLWPKVRGMVGIYYDDPSAMPHAQLRSHAAVELAPGAEVPQGLEALDIAASRVAVLHFKGPYSGLITGYDYLYGTWLPASDLEVGDAPRYEVYRNDPRETAPDDLRTDICIPIL